MGGVVMILLCLYLGSLSFAITTQSPAISPARPPKIWSMAPMGSAPAPILAPTPVLAPHYHGSARSPLPKHHHRNHRAPSPISSVPSQDCQGLTCSDPLTSTPIGSPCGCVLPMSVVFDLGVEPYRLFTHIAELEVEVAAGTFLKQSQVEIMAANPSIWDQGKTRVTIYLVPLGDKFDNTTALLIYERLLKKKVHIDKSTFGDYEIIYIHYPGLPSSPASASVGPIDGPGDFRDHQYPFTADVPTSKSEKLNAGVFAVIAVSSLTLVLACFGIILFIFKWKKLGQSRTPLGPPVAPSFTKRTGMGSIISNSMEGSNSMSFIATITTCPQSVKTFSLSELEKATEKFRSNRILGEGGFGRVYHGILDDGSDVAVKMLTGVDPNSDREFIQEIEMLSRLHHRNLVKLIGICIEENKRCLVYELVRNGSVESHLHGIDKKKGPLNWDARMKIALGAARGLAYLHEDSNPHVIHRDFKASNVLLEEDFTPKVTDFGLAREASEVSQHISTRVMGTFGYVAPEYAMTGHLLVKSDVYSYGVVLLELLSGRKPVYISESQGPENLVTWARPLLTSREGVEQLIDPSLHGNCAIDDVARVAAIASMCVHLEPSQRPFMGEVVQALKLIYNDSDETCEDSYSRKESSSGIDYDCERDFGAESSWWRYAPSLAYGPGSPFMTMEYSSDLAYEMHRPHSTSHLATKMESATRHNRSGPLRTKNKTRTAFYKLRGCISEHGYLIWRLATEGHYDASM